MTDPQATGTASTDAGEPQSTDPNTQAAANTQATSTDGTDTSKPADAAKDEVKTDAEINYEFKAPEGIELAQADLDEFKSIAKDLKLPQEAAQKLVDLAAKREQARAEGFANQVTAWADQVKADKELGNPENLALAQKAVETFGTTELRGLLNSTGMGNHPEVVRAFLKIGKAISEDKIVGSQGSASAQRSPADILYGTPTN